MRRTTLTRKTPLRRTPMARTAPRCIPTSVRRLVLARDGHRCIRCGQHLAGCLYSLHHRKPRGQGGPDTPTNLVTLCGTGTTGCHGWVEHHRAAARQPELGYLVPRNLDPADVPVLVHWLGLVLPVADGWQVAA